MFFTFSLGDAYGMGGVISVPTLFFFFFCVCVCSTFPEVVSFRDERFPAKLLLFFLHLALLLSPKSFLKNLNTQSVHGIVYKSTSSYYLHVFQGMSITLVWVHAGLLPVCH